MTDREAFEVWAKEQAAFCLNYRSDNNEFYETMLSRLTWTAWQAACKYKEGQREQDEYFSAVSDSMR